MEENFNKRLLKTIGGEIHIRVKFKNNLVDFLI